MPFKLFLYVDGLNRQANSLLAIKLLQHNHNENIIIQANVGPLYEKVKGLAKTSVMRQYADQHAQNINLTIVLTGDPSHVATSSDTLLNKAYLTAARRQSNQKYSVFGEIPVTYTLNAQFNLVKTYINATEFKNSLK